VWCPKYRRKVLTSPVDERLKEPIGAQVDDVRRRQHSRRRALQKLGTRSAKRAQARIWPTGAVSAPYEPRPKDGKLGLPRTAQPVVYKAALARVAVVFVDPRNTNRGSPCCGVIDQRTRRRGRGLRSVPKNAVCFR
jgi:hypothetical protein